ncbi:hypothetical protein [Halalkalibacter sp. APA_J-10(15)]|uniref:hypothetical protein n=1 Tax=Halalkalibacter sp. APA_J-10(15) TaxID=2933805 RepID=UPI001FF4EC36|nr:hypothetical protein [Halalkalibacter sp. APA_J-10(15)]MCK0472889.1 hypothetical protein [Halalkalibacter sp. APA_J-10(15)]
MGASVKVSRKLERTFIIIGAAWNLVIALVTMFQYYTWFQREGALKLEETDMNTMIAGSQMVNNVLQVILIYSLFIFVGAIVNFLIAVKLQDDEIQYKVLIWIGVWAAIMLTMTDIIGFALYSIAFVMYLAKNKAIKLAHTKTH